MYNKTGKIYQISAKYTYTKIYWKHQIVVKLPWHGGVAQFESRQGIRGLGKHSSAVV
jgi:hypothetical protein